MGRAFVAVFLLVLLAGCAQDREPKPPSATELTAMLQNKDQMVQIEAAHWVVKLGPAAAETMPALITGLKSPHLSVRQTAARALGALGPDAAKTAVPALTAALDDPETGVRQSAAEALGQFGPAASSAIPALQKLAAQPDKCNTAPAALKKISGKM